MRFADVCCVDLSGSVGRECPKKGVGWRVREDEIPNVRVILVEKHGAIGIVNFPWFRHVFGVVQVIVVCSFSESRTRQYGKFA